VLEDKKKSIHKPYHTTTTPSLASLHIVHCTYSLFLDFARDSQEKNKATMKLDPTVLRTMSSQDFRVMEAVEKGMKDHEIVPLQLISALASLRHGGTHKIISSLLRDKLLSHERKKYGYDGYRLTNAGYDILALHNLKSRGFIAALGQKIGTGKESDIYLGVDPSGVQIVLKFHRLGRTSFRNVKKKRDYFGKAGQRTHSWLFLSRLSALKEYSFMKALHDVEYPTPTPVAHNRHIVVMSLVRGVPLYQIYPKQLSVQQAADIYDQAITLASRLAQHGLVHCDLNEFNLLVDLSGIQALATSSDDPYVRHSGRTVADEKSMGAMSLSKPAWEVSLEEADRIKEALPEPVELLENGEPRPVVTLIDFPQMISTKHPNAEELYNRDLACLRRFFELKLFCTIPEEANEGTRWEDVTKIVSDEAARSASDRLDSELKASGFNDANASKDLELYYFESGPKPINSTLLEGDESDENDEDGGVIDENSGSDEEGGGDRETEDQPTYLDADADAQGGLNKEERVGDVADDISEVESNYPTGESIISRGDLTRLSRAELEEKVRQRVQKQLEDQKRKARKQGAFRKRNSNKTYVKGKRVMSDNIF
jgi:RIO kinase 2